MEYCRNGGCRMRLVESWRVCPACGTRQVRSAWRWAKLIGGRVEQSGEFDAGAPIELDRESASPAPRDPGLSRA